MHMILAEKIQDRTTEKIKRQAPVCEEKNSRIKVIPPPPPHHKNQMVRTHCKNMRLDVRICAAISVCAFVVRILYVKYRIRSGQMRSLARAFAALSHKT